MKILVVENARSIPMVLELVFTRLSNCTRRLRSSGSRQPVSRAYESGRQIVGRGGRGRSGLPPTAEISAPITRVGAYLWLSKCDAARQGPGAHHDQTGGQAISDR